MLTLDEAFEQLRKAWQNIIDAVMQHLKPVLDRLAEFVRKNFPQQNNNYRIARGFPPRRRYKR